MPSISQIEVQYLSHRFFRLHQLRREAEKLSSSLEKKVLVRNPLPLLLHLIRRQRQQNPTRIAAIDLIMEIGYFKRKEAIEAMLEEGLVKKLVELQRSDGGGSLIEIGDDGFDEEEEGVSVERMEKEEKSKERRWLERPPFASCVAMFAIQMEVGEGQRQMERRAFKQEVLKRVREAVISDAEAAIILVEVLWGSSP